MDLEWGWRGFEGKEQIRRVVGGEMDGDDGETRAERA